MHNLIVVALSVVLFACGKQAAVSAPDASGTATTAPAPTSATTAPAPTSATRADDPDAASGTSAASDAEGARELVTTCPHALEGNDLGKDRVITKACGIVTITGHYAVDDGTLTLEAGATLAFKDGADLEVGYAGAAKLIVKGTKDEPVTFTAMGDKVPGVWAGVRLRANADRSSLEHLVLEWAGAEDGAALRIEAEDVAIAGGVIRGSKGYGLEVDRGLALKTLTGVTFGASGKAALHLDPRAVAAIGSDNVFPAEGIVELWGGTVDRAALWPSLGVPYILPELVRVEGPSAAGARLELAAGVELRLGAGAYLEVGYDGTGTLLSRGTAERPVLVTAAGEKKPGAHAGIRVYGGGSADLRGIVVEYAGDDGAVRTQGGRLNLDGATLRHSGLCLDLGGETALEAVVNTRFEDCPKGAIHLAPAQLGAVGAGNSYEAGLTIELDGGVVKTTATWTRQSAPIVVAGAIQIDERGALTIAPGVRLVMREGTGIQVGNSATASLVAEGSAEAPIELSGERNEAGVWDGIVLYGQTRDTRLRFVKLAHVKGESGAIDVREGAVATVSTVSCAKCAGPVLAWQCQAKVTEDGIEALDGTPRAVARPECP